MVFMRHLRQQPRAALGAAPDHHAIRARLCHGGAGIRSRADIAIGQHRNRDRLFHGPDRRPIGASFIELTARAPVNHQPRDARRFGARGQIRRVERIRVPAKPGFQRDRHSDRADHGLDQAQRMIGGSRISAEPDIPPVTFLAGHPPMLMSITRAPPMSATRRAASAIECASRPAICTAVFSTPPAPPSSAFSALPGGRAVRNSPDAIISDTTSPAPKRLTNCRKADP